MYEERKISVTEAVPLLRRCGLGMSHQKPQYTVGIYPEGSEELLATGSLVGDMLQMMAVDPEHQGEDLLAKLVTHLLRVAFERGITQIYVFTKYEKRTFFQGIGFSLVAEVPGKAALLEWERRGISTYCARLKEQAGPCAGRVGALVMNCNPFTLGHRYLIQQASQACDHVVVLAVEEDQSVFPFDVRFRLLQQGAADFSNVSVVAGGRYVISSLTFPSYFTKAADLADVQAAMDAEIFRRYLVPALGITDRFLGSEPYSPVTDIYNHVITETLEPAGVGVHIIPRFEIGGAPVSASRVRALIAAGRLSEVRPLVPDTTWQYLNSADFQKILPRFTQGGI